MLRHLATRLAEPQTFDPPLEVVTIRLRSNIKYELTGVSRVERLHDFVEVAHEHGSLVVRADDVLLVLTPNTERASDSDGTHAER